MGALQEQFQGQFAELHQKLDDSQTEVAALRNELAALRNELAQRGPGTGTGRTPKVNPPVVYDGKSKELADQFLHQISSAAKFQTFADDEQKILWAESFLSSQAHTWSATITSHGDPADNPRRYIWTDWVKGFTDAFCTRDPQTLAITRLGVLNQGTKTITAYCTEFRDLVTKLDKADQEGGWVRQRFWDGLNAMGKSSLVNTDYKTVEEAQDILLRREIRLGDVEAATRTHNQQSSARPVLPSPQVKTVSPRAPVPQASTPYVRPVQHIAQSAPPPATKDPNAMDVDGSRKRRLRCFNCGAEGHRIADCPDFLQSLKAAVLKDVPPPSATNSSPPPKGFL